MSDSIADSTVAPKTSSGTQALLDLYADKAKKEGVGDAPSSIKGSFKKKDESEISERETKIGELKSAFEQHANDDGLKIDTNPEDILNKEKLDMNIKTVDSFIDVVREASNQIGVLGHDAPILKDDNLMKVIFSVASANASDDEDVERAKKMAGSFMSQVRLFKKGKVDQSVENLLFSNDVGRFVDTLSSMVRADGLKMFSRANDGSIGKKVLKMVKGYGDMQEHAATVLMGKIDELLTSSPDRGLLEDLTRKEMDALYSLRETVAKEFVTITSSELSKRYDDANSITDAADKDKALAQLGDIGKMQKLVSELYEAKTGTEYKKAQKALTEHQLGNFSQKYKVGYELNQAEEVLNNLKNAERSDTPTAFTIPTSLIAGSVEDSLAAVVDTFNQANSFKADDTNAEANDYDSYSRLEAALNSVSAEDRADKTKNGNDVAITNANGEEITKVKLGLLKHILENTSSDDPRSIQDGLDEAGATKNKDNYIKLLDATQAALTKENKSKLTGDAKKYAELADKIKKDLKSIGVDVQALDIKDVASKVKEIGEDKVETITSALIKDEVAAWTVNLSKEDDARIESIRTLINDAKSKLSDDDRDIKNLENLEYKVIFKPMGKHAETVASALRKGIQDYAIDEDNEMPKDFKDLITSQAKASIGTERLAYLEASINSREALKDSGIATTANTDINEALGLLGVENNKVDNFYSNTLGELRTVLNKDLKDSKFASVFSFTAGENTKLTSTPGEKASESDKAKLKAEQLAIVVDKLKSIQAQTQTSSEFETAIKGNAVLTKAFSQLGDGDDNDKLDVLMKKIATVKDQIKTQEDTLKSLKKERDAWNSSRADSTGIFEFGAGKTYAAQAMVYLNTMLSRMFNNAGDATKKSASEEISEKVKAATENLDSDNKQDEALQVGLNRFGTIENVVTYQNTRGLAREIAANNTIAA